jgi:hypothetical protein
MKTAGFSLLAALALALMFSGSALGQNTAVNPPGDPSYYFVTYYSNNVSGAPDATLRLINDGDQGQNLVAGIYVFDDSEEMEACGYCPITPDGILSEDVKTELTNNTLTPGGPPSRGVIKVLSLLYINVGGGVGYGTSAGIHGWASHVQSAGASKYALTETPLADSNLSPGEFENLPYICGVAQQLGSGRATITCTAEDHDF